MNTVRTIVYWLSCVVGAIVTIGVALYFIGLGLRVPDGTVLSVYTFRELSHDPVNIMGNQIGYVIEWVFMQRPGDGWAIYGFIFSLVVLYMMSRVAAWIQQQPVPTLIGYSFGYPRVNIGLLEQCYVELDSKGLPQRFPRLPKGHHLVCSLSTRQDISFFECFNKWDMLEMYQKLQNDGFVELDWHSTADLKKLISHR